MCSRLASDQGSGRQLLSGRVCWAEGYCHTSRSEVPGGGRKGAEGEEKTAVSRSWVFRRTGIYPRALPSLHPKPSSRGTPVTFLWRGSSGHSRPCPTHAWVRVPMTHITSLPRRNEEAGLPNWGGAEPLSKTFSPEAPVQSEEDPMAWPHYSPARFLCHCTLRRPSPSLSVVRGCSFGLWIPDVSIRAAFSPELPGLQSSLPGFPGFGKEEPVPCRACWALCQQICSSFPCNRSGAR